MKVFFVTL